MRSTKLKNSFERYGTNHVPKKFGEEYVSLDRDRIRVAYECIRQTTEPVLHGQGDFPHFDECASFRFLR
jgi:hypothetical protein